MDEQGFLPGIEVERFKVPKSRVIKTSDGWNPRLHYHIVQDERALTFLRKTLTEHNADGFAWDTETSGLKPELGARICGHCIAVRTGERDIAGFYVPVRHIGRSNEHEPQLAPERVVEVLQPFFEPAEAGEVATYHRKFDAKMARADGLYLRRAAADVAVDATVANENEPRFGLKALSEKYCTPLAKGEQDQLEKWLRKDARQLDLSYKKHTKKQREKLGLDALTTPTYLERFGYSRAPVRLAAVYGIHDAFYTWWLSRVYFRSVRTQYPAVWEREHTVGLMMEDMEWHGLPANEAAIRDTHERTKNAVKYWLQRAKEAVPQFIGDSFEAGDTDLRRLFYTDLKMEPPKFTEGQEPSVDREARQLLKRKYPQWGELFRALDQLAGDPTRPGLMKLHSTYAGNYLRFYSPITKSIHPSYNQLEQRKKGGAPVTGRMSSADPNCQNVAGATIHLWDCYCSTCLKEAVKDAEGTGHLPFKTPADAMRYVQERGHADNTVSIRRYFIVPEGYIRVFIDFSQIELRVLAWFCQDPNLLHAYHNDLDVHQMVADQLSIKRKVAKQVNFGNSYGMTEIGLALRIPGYYDDPEGTRVFAKQVLQAYFSQYANILEFKRRFADAMRHRDNMFINPFGRPRRIPSISASGDLFWMRKRAERQMMSSIISGTSADLMKESMRRTWPIAQAAGGRLSQTIHDELVFDLPKKPGWAKTVVKLVRAMEHWPFFSEDRFYEGRHHQGLPIKTSVELTTTTWEDKKSIEVYPDGTFAWAA